MHAWVEMRAEQSGKMRVTRRVDVGEHVVECPAGHEAGVGDKGADKERSGM